MNASVVRLPVAAPPPAPDRRERADREPVKLKAPAWLSPSGRAAFRRVAVFLEDDAPDWLAEVDADALGLAVEHLAVAVAASRAMRGSGGHYAIIDVDAGHGGRRRKHPAHQVFREATAAYLAVIRELGLTPRARRELEVGLGFAPAEDDDDPAGIFDA
jgi:P27 family predicted phage terminase small subunit